MRAVQRLVSGSGALLMTPIRVPERRASAQSGHTSRPVIVYWNGSRTRWPQSGQSLPDNATAPPRDASRQDGRVARGGVEPPTFRFSGGRSYQLSYLA